LIQKYEPKKMFLFDNELLSPIALINSALDALQRKLAVILVQLLLAIFAVTRFLWLIFVSSTKDFDFCGYNFLNFASIYPLVNQKAPRYHFYLFPYL